MESKKFFYPRSKEEWRSWLVKNHAKEKKIYVIKYKRHTGKPSITHQESMDEAICFGWIDTTVKKLDDVRYTRCFVRRSDKSRWSSATLSYAKRLIAEGRMTPAGLVRYQEGLLKPTLDHGLLKNPVPPADLIKALGRFPKAKMFFDGLAPSYKRWYVYCVERAKRSETRQKRIKLVVDRCKLHKKPGL